jgi:hypothetical protein
MPPEVSPRSRARSRMRHNRVRKTDVPVMRPCEWRAGALRSKSMLYRLPRRGKRCCPAGGRSADLERRRGTRTVLILSAMVAVDVQRRRKIIGTTDQDWRSAEAWCNRQDPQAKFLPYIFIGPEIGSTIRNISAAPSPPNSAVRGGANLMGYKVWSRSRRSQKHAPFPRHPSWRRNSRQ